MGLHRTADRVVKQQEDGLKNQAVMGRHEDPGDEPPDLAPENQTRVEIEQTVEGISGIHLAQQVYHGADNNINQHEIRNAEMRMVVAEFLDFSVE
jgi:hypothetical protein